MGKRRPIFICTIGPFQYGHSFPGGAARFPKGAFRVVRLVEDVPEENQIKRSVREGQFLRYCLCKDSLGRMGAGQIQQLDSRVDPCCLQAGRKECLGENSRTRSDIENGSNGASIGAYPYDPRRFKQRDAGWRAETLRAAMESLFVRHAIHSIRLAYAAGFFFDDIPNRR